MDVRHGVRLDRQTLDIASFAGGAARRLSVYRVNPLSRQLERLESTANRLTQEVQGSCLYVSPNDNASYVFALSAGGTVNQLKLQVNQGRLSLPLARTFKVGAEARSCVTDDELGAVYVAAGRSIFKYNAEPEAPADNASRTSVAGPTMTANVAGLTLYYASDGTGYLLASQGSNEIAVFRREGTNAFVTKLTTGRSATVTGIDVANYPFGSSFPMGVLVAQDRNQLRLIPWDQLANSARPPLTIDPFRNPRNTGVELDPPTQSPAKASTASIESSSTSSRAVAAEGGNTGGSTSVAVPTPTAASLAKFGDIPVSLYTGTPNIQIPLYELQGRKLSVPISLSYHASGVKVGETPGWVGLGWSLNAGGVITRTVRGLADDGLAGYHDSSAELDKVWNNVPEDYLRRVLEKSLDSEPDDFFFNFDGNSGKFVMGTDDIRTIPYGKLRFEFERGTTTVVDRPIYGVTRWTVTDESGTRYIFEDIEWFYERDANDCTLCGHASAWYLSKIQSADGKDEITFQYERTTDPIVYPQQTYREEIRIRTTACQGPTQIVQENKSENLPIWLSKVTSAQGTLDFITTSGREDLPHERQLDQILIKSAGGDKAKAFVFGYGYFRSGSSTRLRLDRVAEQSSSGADCAKEGHCLPPYKFTYDESSLPDRLFRGISLYEVGLVEKREVGCTRLRFAKGVEWSELPTSASGSVYRDREAEAVGLARA